MLSNAQRALIKATVPLLETGGEALITHFYRTMLGEYPEVRPLFNQAHQASGDQPRALANGVLMYARHIDQLQELGPLVAKVVNKHVSCRCCPNTIRSSALACCGRSARSSANRSPPTKSSKPGARPTSNWPTC